MARSPSSAPTLLTPHGTACVGVLKTREEGSQQPAEPPARSLSEPITTTAELIKCHPGDSPRSSEFYKAQVTFLENPVCGRQEKQSGNNY